MFVYINGKFYTETEAKVSVFDHGFLYGDGVFETLRAYNGKIFLLAEHLNRLQNSARLVYLSIPDNSYFEKILYTSLRKNKLQDAYIRLSISRGVGKIGLSPTLCKKPTIVVIAQPFQPYPEKLYEEGVAIKIVKTRRIHPLSLPVEAKTTNFLNNILAKIDLQSEKIPLVPPLLKGDEGGFFEAIMLNLDGYITEGTISNIFIVKKPVLYTPSVDCGLLPGVTRNYVIRLAKKLGIKVNETKLKPQDLYTADECFLTNTSVEILPVKQIDKYKFGNELSNFFITQKLRSHF